MLYSILIFLFVIVSALMTVSILMQSAKGGGLAASFGGVGGGGGVLGPRGAANFLQKATTVLATGYLILCLMIGLVGRPVENTGSVVQQELQKQEAATQQPAGLPTAPIQTTQPAGNNNQNTPKTPGN